MPSDIAVRVENLGKRYVIGRKVRQAKTLAGRVRESLGSPFSWLSSQLRGPSEEETLWALRDVSFEVKRGEVLGVIGRNGAGKSTLLRILSRITEPTAGHAEMHGRIGALLEVGTGMHPELTGRENIYLNGTIIGMRKIEIDGKFDEIVDFSGIERFLDTPVKRYSSGMRVRLGFAIAAHLEPEILIVDEVLAVGDAEFQRKCLGKMKDVAGHGRTVLFVSHNMGAVRSLCVKGLVLCDGHLSFSGSANESLGYYRKLGEGETSSGCERDLRGRENPYGPRPVIERVSLRLGGLATQACVMGDEFRLAVDVRWPARDRGILGIVIKDANGVWLTSMNTEQMPLTEVSDSCQRETVCFRIPALPLLPEQYSIGVIAAERHGGRIDMVETAVGMTVQAADVFGTGKTLSKHHGIFFISGSTASITATPGGCAC